jgi:hypothetical protein
MNQRRVVRMHREGVSTPTGDAVNPLVLLPVMASAIFRPRSFTRAVICRHGPHRRLLAPMIGQLSMGWAGMWRGAEQVVLLERRVYHAIGRRRTMPFTTEAKIFQREIEPPAEPRLPGR